MLEVRSLSVSYGTTQAVIDVDFTVEHGQALTILGPNGAGKTSLLKGLSGLVPSHSETVALDHVDLRRMPPHRRVHSGIVHVPEGRRVFAPLTVHENLEMGAYAHRRHGDATADVESAYESFPALAELRDRTAGMLSGGQQQMLALARGLLSRPRVLMLDEPSLGLAPVAVKAFYDVLQREREKRPELIVVLVEQNASSALSVASEALVLANGQVRFHGPSSNLSDNNELLRAYLGAAPEGDPNDRR